MTDFDNIELSNNSFDWAETMIPMINDSCKESFSKLYGSISNLPDLVYAGHKTVKIIHVDECDSYTLETYLKHLLHEYPLLINTGLSYTADMSTAIKPIVINIPYIKASANFKIPKDTLNIIKFITSIEINNFGINMNVFFRLNDPYVQYGEDTRKFKSVKTIEDVHKLRLMLSHLYTTLYDNKVELKYTLMDNMLSDLYRRICEMLEIDAQIDKEAEYEYMCLNLESFNNMFDDLLTYMKTQSPVFRNKMMELETN